MWRKRDSFVRKPLILRELLNFKFTRLVELVGIPVERERDSGMIPNAIPG